MLSHPHAFRHDPPPANRPLDRLFARPPVLVEPVAATLLTICATDGCPPTEFTLDLEGSRHLRPGSNIHVEGVPVAKVTDGGGTTVRLCIDSAALRAAMELMLSRFGPAAPACTVHEPGPRLSPRQLEVLGLVASGCSNKHIALALGVSPATIKTHVATAIATIGARNRTDAAIRARERGWI